MNSYHCYFFGSTDSFLGAAPNADDAASVAAGSDDEARQKAEAMSWRQDPPIYGFELWQGNRLVCRQKVSGEQEAPCH